MNMQLLLKSSDVQMHHNLCYLTSLRHFATQRSSEHCRSSRSTTSRRSAPQHGFRMNSGTPHRFRAFCITIWLQCIKQRDLKVHSPHQAWYGIGKAPMPLQAVPTSAGGRLHWSTKLQAETLFWLLQCLPS